MEGLLLDVGGNASPKVKQTALGILKHHLPGTGFADGIGKRLVLKDVSVVKKADEPEKMEGRTVLELNTDQGEFIVK